MEKTYTKLNCYSEKAMEIFKSSTGSLYPGQFVRMPDNEIAYDTPMGEHSKTHILLSVINDLTFRATPALRNGKTKEEKDMYRCLAAIVRGDVSEQPEEVRMYATELKGEPLDPIRTAAIETLERECKNTDEEATKKILAFKTKVLEKARLRKIELADQIKQLRGVSK